MMNLVFDGKSVVKGLTKLRKDVLRDTANSINRAATASKKRVDKDLAGITGAKATRVKRLSKVDARARAFGVIRMFAIIRWAGKKLPVYSLAKGRVSPSGSGSVAKLKGGSQFYAGAFKLTVNKGRYTGLFKKKGRSVTEVKMDSNPDLFRNKGIGVIEEKRSLGDVDKFYDVAVAKRLAKFNKEANR